MLVKLLRQILEGGAKLLEDNYYHFEQGLEENNIAAGSQYKVFQLVRPKEELQPEKELFSNIVGYQNLKKLFIRAVTSKGNIHVILIGPPGTAKSLFLLELEKQFDSAVYFDCANASGAGLIEYLFNHPNTRYLLLDEIDKLKRNDQNVLLNLMETGVLTSTKVRKTMTQKMDGIKIFATSNDAERMVGPLKSRFLVLHIDEYTYEEFQEISVKLLPENYKHDIETARAIADAVWNKLSSKDLRDILKAGKLVYSIDDIEWYVETIKEHSECKSREKGDQ